METQYFASLRIEMCKADPKRWMVIDGSLSKDAIEKIIWDRVSGLLPKR